MKDDGMLCMKANGDGKEGRRESRVDLRMEIVD